MLKSKKFWAYEPSQSYDLKQEVFDNYKIKGRFYDDVLYFFDQMGIAPHPGLRAPANRESFDVNAVNLINNKVDVNTIKILIHLLPYTKIISLKLCSNDFEINNLELLVNSLVSKPNNIYYVSYEWNDKLTTAEGVISRNEEIAQEQYKELFDKQSELIYKLFKNTKFEGICIRGNLLGDDTIIEIFKLLETQQYNSQVKVLSLYKNNLTSKCIDSFCSMLLKNKKLEEVNFGNNKLTDEDVEKIKNHIGKYPMTMEEVENYNKKAKERDQIIAKNVKLKISKKPELEVPYLDEMCQIGEKFYIVKNKNLRVLNFMQNPLTEKCFDSIKYMLDYNDDLLITIDENTFKPSQEEILLDRNGKYFNRIYFSKK